MLNHSGTFFSKILDLITSWITALPIKYIFILRLIQRRQAHARRKADITGLPLERVIKGIYLEDANTKKMYGLFIPGTQHSSDIRLTLGDYLCISHNEIIKDNRITKARKEFLDSLGIGIEFGTVHPFVNEKSFKKSRLEAIFFDINHLEKRKNEGELDDFSITTHPSTGYDNHRLSIQINYNDAYTILKEKFPESVKAIELI